MKRYAAILSVVLALATAGALGLYMLLPRLLPSRPPQPSPEQFPIMGIDISSHNGPVDFYRLVADSIDFVMIKATEGATFKDPAFHSNYMAARQAGIPAVGAYHFFRFDTDGKMQAINLINSLRGKDTDLPLAIDLEEWTNPRDVDTRLVVERLQAMIDYLEANAYSVMIYTNKDGYDRFVRGRFDDYPLWICSFTDPPMPPGADVPWVIWQYSHWGWVSACPDSDVDLNTFRGSRAQWAEWLREADF